MKKIFTSRNHFKTSVGPITNGAAKDRFGFTLVELLVAITIFVILMTLALGAFNLNAGNERIRLAASQLQAMLEGAKARAYKGKGITGSENKVPVGVRFIIDPDSPANTVEITSMMYIEGQADPAGGGYETGTLRYVDGDGDLSNATVIEAIQYADVQGNTGISWSSLKDQGMIQAGVRIRIPAKTGKWYRISSLNFLTDSNQSIMRLTEPLLDVTSSSFSLVNSQFTNQSKTVAYELDLSSVMGPRPNEEQVLFPKGIVIDLTSSKVPSNWRIGRWVAGGTYSTNDWILGVSGDTRRVYRAESGGTSGTTEPSWPLNPGTSVVDNGITWRCFETPHFDVIFSPQGTVMGSVVADGLLHFVLAETRDTHEIFEDYPNTGDVTIGLPAWDLSDRNGDGETPDHLGSFRVVTVFPASGAVNVSPIDQTDSNSDNVADNLFRFAIEGSTAK